MEGWLCIREKEQDLGFWFYEISHSFITAGDIVDALACLCNSFFIRSNSEDFDPLWMDFYKIQMSIYILGKKNLKISLPEGDMVYDLIRDKWEEIVEDLTNSPFGPIKNPHEWFKTIQIDFPFVPSQCIVI